uniref:Uncharacterized protein n=1 Tax=Pararge aegeria TaxID=116150 RepID=S4NWM4_9NEOP
MVDFSHYTYFTFFYIISKELSKVRIGRVTVLKRIKHLNCDQSQDLTEPSRFVVHLHDTVGHQQCGLANFL